MKKKRPKLLKLNEFARRLRVSESTALRMVKSKGVPFINVSAGAKRARYRIPASYLQKMTAEIPQPESPLPSHRDSDVPWII